MARRSFLWDRSCNRPHATNPNDKAGEPLIPSRKRRIRHSYSVLLPMGFALPPALPKERCALTAPFHPCLQPESLAGGLFSVALSLGSPPPAVSRHRSPVEPGLSSIASVRTNATAIARPSDGRNLTDAWCGVKPHQWIFSSGFHKSATKIGRGYLLGQMA